VTSEAAALTRRWPGIRSVAALAAAAALPVMLPWIAAAAGTAEGSFAQKCAHCHGARLEGGRAASLLDGVWLFGGDPASIAGSIREGRPAAGMPPFRDALSDEEVRELVGFILARADEAQRALGPAESGAAPDLALQYDFYDVQGTRVPDGSGHEHTGTIAAGRVVDGRRKPAIELDGAGAVTADLLGRDVDLAGRAMTIGAMCRPSAPDGVIVSMEDATDGFRLHLQGGVPRFSVRVGGALHEVAGTEPLPLGQWSHVAGVIGARGGLALLVNAWTVAEAHTPSPLTRTPAGPFTVGAPAAPPSEGGAARWRGLLEDVRLYRVAISREAHHELLAEWANRPGCGCRRQYDTPSGVR